MTFVLNAFSSILNFTVWWLDTDKIKTPQMESSSDPYIDGTWAEDVQQWSKIFSDKLSWILHLPKPEQYTDSLWYVLSLVRISINRILWLLAFVALVYFIYCWALVLFSWSENKNADKGKKWISTAAIALAWIGLSWLIVSVIIWFINLISNT